MDTPLPAPSTLGDIYSMNPGAFGQAQDIIQQGQQSANLSQMMNQQTYNQNQVMDPLRATALQAANDTSAANLPGIVASSSMKTRANSNDEKTNDLALQNAIEKLGHEKTQMHVDDLNTAGALFRQHGAMAFANPIGAGDRLKADLAAAGHADMYNPEWDTLDPGARAQAYTDTGNDIGKSTEKMLQLSAGIQAKNDQAVKLEKTKQEGRMEVQTARDATAKQIADGVRSAKLALDKPSMQQLAARMSGLAQAAQADGDTIGYQKYIGLANEYMDQARSIPQQSAGVSNEKTLDLNKIKDGDISTVPPRVAPRLGAGAAPVAPASAPPQMPAAPAASAATGFRDPVTGNIPSPPNVAIDTFKRNIQGGTPAQVQQHIQQFNAIFGPGTGEAILQASQPSEYVRNNPKAN